MNLLRLVPFCLVALTLIGCGKKEVPYTERSVEDLYTSAHKELRKGDYEEAAKLFDETERQHPYSEWATRAQLMSAYAYFMGQKYSDASTAVEAFIQLHPGHKDIDYALYMKGMIYYEQIPTVQRDQNLTLDALEAFQKLTRRFPSSKYGRAAKPKIDLIQDHLAGNEMYVGRFYLNKQSYFAAIGRFETVLNEYEKTSHVPEALHRLVEAYMALGMEEQAQKTAAILGHNFPGSAWYADTYYILKGKDFRLPAHKKDNLPWYKRVF